MRAIRFPNPIESAAAVMGGTALAAQIVLGREILTVVSGNELMLGVVLGSWLVWSAAGSLMGSRLRAGSGFGRLSLVLFALALALPLGLLAVRCSRAAFSLMPGERMPLLPMLAVIQASVCGTALLAGLFFPLACRAAAETGLSSAARIYRWEAAGSCIGGLAAVLALAANPPSFAILWILSGFAFACGLSLLYFNSRLKRMLYILGLTVWIVPLLLSGRIEQSLDRMFWKEYDLIESRNGAYGKLTVTKTGDMTGFFENGVLVFAVPDPASAEVKIHYPLLMHSDPKRILLLGGGLGGGIDETLKHPSVEAVDAVEIDPELVEMTERLLPLDKQPWRADSRIRLVLDDGRRFVRRTEVKYDAILVDMPNPMSAQINRYYTVEFFREIRERLNPGGLLALSISASENVIGAETADLLAVIRASLSDVFSRVVVLPGDITQFVAGDDTALSVDPVLLEKRMVERGIRNQFVKDYHIRYRLSAEKLAYIDSRLDEAASNRLNRDLRPAAYTDDLFIWAARFSPALQRMLSTVRKINLAELAIFAALAMSVSWSIAGKKSEGKYRFGQGVLIAGFTGMALEMALLFLYQTSCGVLYRDMAWIMAGYMAGLAGGGRIVETIRQHRAIRWAGMAQASLAGLSGCVVLLGWIRVPVPLAVPLFALATALCGFAAGIQFVSANRAAGRGALMKTAGLFYGLDLIGSALGALVTAAFLLPIIGMVQCLILLAGMNGLAALGIFMLRRKTRNSASKAQKL